MSNNTTDIRFDHVGLAAVLKNNNLKVPVNQREYSWESDNVEDLFQDFQLAIENGPYFLGTIVLTQGKKEHYEVADGQQRLATTMILIAAIRDYFIETDDLAFAASLETDFLSTYDRDERTNVPKLILNVDDREYFQKIVLSKPKSPDRHSVPNRESHRRIKNASAIAAKRVRMIVDVLSEKYRGDKLNEWVKFLTFRAQVIQLIVPDFMNAFRMFETLNDRGLKTTQADLLKNYLFSESGSRIEEAQHKWSSMTGVLESVEKDDIVLVYLRHLLIARHGVVRERHLFEIIKKQVKGSIGAIQFLEDLSENAITYTALLNKNHSMWSSFGQYTNPIRRSIETLAELRLVLLRPLMLACVKKFSKIEVEKSLRTFICWSVRHLITGTPPGRMESIYASAAMKIWNGEIRNTSNLFDELKAELPTDEQFRNAFSTASISKSQLARYVLRSLETKMRNDKEPEFVVNSDQDVLTLEHVIPENPPDNWDGLIEADSKAYYRRIGNLTLLTARSNSGLGTAPFAQKKAIYENSSNLFLNRQIVEKNVWGKSEVEDRQKLMAEIAVATWPLLRV